MVKILRAVAARVGFQPADRKAPKAVAGVRRSDKWPAVRDAHLKRSPSCVCCGRRTDLNVHHVKPYHLFPELELDDGNLVTLCEGPSNCHWLVGHRGLSWETYQPDVTRAATAYGATLKFLAGV